MEVLWRMLPVTLSVMASPIAILAVLGMLQSTHPFRTNACYLAGWAVATTVSLIVWLTVLHLVGVSDAHPDSPLLRALHAVISAVCFAGATWMYRRSRATLERVAAAKDFGEFAAAAPQLPAILRESPDHSARRSFVVGIGVFLLNPTNAPLVAATAIDLLNAQVSATTFAWLCVGFVIAVCVPIAVPVIVVSAGRRAPDETVSTLRGWVLRNGGFLRAGMLLLVGFLQLSRAVTGGGS